MKNLWNRLRLLLSRLTPWHWFLVFTLFFIQFESQHFNDWRHHQTPFLNDADQYYSYLPATFIHHAPDFKYPNSYWLVKGSNGNKVPKYTIGVALLQAPFFMIGHVGAWIFHYPMTGYSQPYNRAACGAAIFYALLGLYFLYKTLIRFFHPRASALSLFILLFATNLFYYVVSFPLMSHAFSFGMFGVFLYATVKCWKDKSVPALFLAAVSAGLIALIRPPDVIVLLLPLLMGVHQRSALRDWWGFLMLRKIYAGLAALTFLLICFIQPLYWYLVTGSWFVNGYGDERFFFGDPQMINFIFSYRKGLIPYAPVMIFSLLGFLFLFLRFRELFWPVIIYTLVNIYVLSCWWDWTYGGSFGNRAILQSFVVLAIPLTALIHAGYNFFKTKQARRRVFTAMLGIACLFSAFNFSLIHKYIGGFIHWDDMTKESYWYVIPKWKWTAEDKAHAEKMERPVNIEKFKAGIGRDDSGKSEVEQ